ncbi:MAG: dienelactone hydrolase family protein [Longimicrobiales bacterium]
MNRPGPTNAEEARIAIGDAAIVGDLALPPEASRVVLFAHGSGSSRHSARNRAVAAVLQRAGLGTLLIDLLTEAEERVDVVTREHRFDIPLLAERIVGASEWLRADERTKRLDIGGFGASTGGGAALLAAADRPDLIVAVVSRGGRPDLAGAALARVQAPTLLIVGGQDHEVLELNRAALEQLRCEKRLHIVPGATHLFEEAGALEEVAAAAAEWFTAH